MDGTTERIETVVIGGGQAGLAAGYHLAERGRPFVILDADTRIGESWRNRWDSLVLFTPARYCGLPGSRFPLAGGSFPTKDDVADYLEQYAARFELPVRTDVCVDRVTRRGDGGFLVRAGDLRIDAENVIVATGANREARVPLLADELDPAIIQLHSSEYRRPAQLREGGVLIVGAGNSGPTSRWRSCASTRPGSPARTPDTCPFGSRRRSPDTWSSGSSGSPAFTS